MGGQRPHPDPAPSRGNPVSRDAVSRDAVSTDALVGRWLRAPEYDDQRGRAYARDRGARSRPRDVLELREGGQFLETKIGGADRPSRGAGRWTVSDRTLCLFDGDANAPSHTLDIVEVTADRLIVRDTTSKTVGCEPPQQR